jgi:hypothetical protein
LLSASGDADHIGANAVISITVPVNVGGCSDPLSAVGNDGIGGSKYHCIVVFALVTSKQASKPQTAHITIVVLHLQLGLTCTYLQVLEGMLEADRHADADTARATLVVCLPACALRTLDRALKLQPVLILVLKLHAAWCELTTTVQCLHLLVQLAAEFQATRASH